MAYHVKTFEQGCKNLYDSSALGQRSLFCWAGQLYCSQLMTNVTMPTHAPAHVPAQECMHSFVCASRNMHSGQDLNPLIEWPHWVLYIHIYNAKSTQSQDASDARDYSLNATEENAQHWCASSEKHLPLSFKRLEHTTTPVFKVLGVAHEECIFLSSQSMFSILTMSCLAKRLPLKPVLQQVRHAAASDAHLADSESNALTH